MRDKQIAHQTPIEHDTIQQIISQSTSILNTTKAIQLQNVKQVKAPNVQSNFNFNLQNMFQQPTPEQQVQNFVRLSEQFQNEIGKMNTEYQQFVAANLDQNHIKQMMQQKLQAIEKFGNQLEQSLNKIQPPN